MGVSSAIRIAQQVIGMTITGKWSEELKYNLMQYGKVNKICIFIVILLVTFIAGYVVGDKQNQIIDNKDVVLPDTTYNKVTLDSIEYNIIKKDSTVYKLKEEVKDEIEKALNADDSIAVEQFKSLSTAR